MITPEQLADVARCRAAVEALRARPGLTMPEVARRVYGADDPGMQDVTYKMLLALADAGIVLRVRRSMRQRSRRSDKWVMAKRQPGENPAAIKGRLLAL